MSPSSRRGFLSIAIALICSPGVMSAQWLHDPTPDVPRTAAGKPDLTAPPPRLSDGRTDFSGIWQPAVKIPCTPEFSRFVECGLEIGGSPSALNIGAGVTGGLPYQAWAAVLVKQRTEDNSKDDPHARCLPDNPPRPSDAARMTDRLRRPNYGTLEVTITIDDPKACTRSWTVEMNQKITLDTELVDEMCLENEKSFQRMRGK